MRLLENTVAETYTLTAAWALLATRYELAAPVMGFTEHNSSYFNFF
jgi:hypothetical protein